MNWSPYQDAIFRFITEDAGNASIEAVAGSGKTSTIVEAANRLPPTARALFLAFNKSIALELGARLPANVEAKTLNALGHGAWCRYTGKRTIKLNTDKTRDIIRDVMSDTEEKIYGFGVRRLVALAKTVGIVPQATTKTVLGGLVEDNDDEWQGLIDWFDLDFGEGASIDYAIDLAREVLEKSIYSAVSEIDFDDQIYMTTIMRVPMNLYDFVFVDEAQDLNAMQRQMLRMSLRPNGRLVAVGDPHQAIYGFRGADSQSMANLQSEFRTTTLPLSISYRCPKAVVAEAQRFVSHIQASDTAPDGEVITLGTFDHTHFDATDAIVCRANAPIIGMAFKLLRKQIPVRVLGREIGAGLIVLIKKMRASSLVELDTKLLDHQTAECEKFMRCHMEQKAEALMDRISTIQVFMDALEPGNQTIDALIRLIESLFTDNNRGRLTLCTVHKAKGLEWHRVFILNPQLMPSKYATQEWQQAQEVNIQYVAVTRARQRLAYIDDKKWAEEVTA